MQRMGLCSCGRCPLNRDTPAMESASLVYATNAGSCVPVCCGSVLMSLAVRRLRSERPGFDSGFGPTAMSEMVRAVGLSQQRRNERRHFGITLTDVDRRRRGTKRRNLSPPHDSHANAELSTGTGPEGQLPLAPYQGRGRYPAHKRGRVRLPLGALAGVRPAC